MKQVLATGVIRSPHGVHGYLKVHPFADDYSHFFSLKEVVLSKAEKERNIEIEDVKEFSGELLVKFKGIDTPEDARFFSGWDILVPREKASKLAEGEVYTADLQGMKLLYNKEEAGVVVSVMEGAQSLLLEVKTLDGKIRLVPYMKGIFIDDVSVSEGTIRLLNIGLLS